MAMAEGSRYPVSTMAHRFTPFCILIVFLALPGCGLVQALFPSVGKQSSKHPRGYERQSVLEQIALPIRDDVDRLLPGAYKDLLTSHETAETLPAKYKRRAAVETLKQPWEGLINLEEQGLLVAELAEGGSVNLPGLLDVLEAGMDRTSTFHKPIPLPGSASPQTLLSFMTDSLAEASQLRDKAIGNLSDDERAFIFDHARALAGQFTPQTSNLSDRTLAQAKASARFAELLEERIDYAHLIAAAQVLSRLANERWLHYLAAAYPHPLPQARVPTGITGEVLLVEQTSYGLIVIGGRGPNTYELDKRFGLVIDLGGDDLYRGLIASSSDMDRGNAVVIDVEGNDTYNGDTLGLATGRLGVGLLIDHAGDDVYQLEMGSGGAGFAGLGILYDGKGNDAYMGNRLTQGAAIGGLGLLFDAAGNDRYTSHAFALGFGGPSGVGAIVDVKGDDRYQCGDKLPSAYNAQDAPNAKPGDPQFQYDCFGLGAGVGSRILTKRADLQTLSLAGGWGLLLDIAGQDKYQSANFSQGHGYFFGAAVMMDLEGSDDYHAARYGQGSSAHHGVSVFVDRSGDDRYGSTGPFYNAGVAWDHGVSAAVDGGSGNDRYQFEQTTGLGAGDIHGFGLFVEEGGNDQYSAKSGLGHSSDHGIGGFFDLNGRDTYVVPSESALAGSQQPADNKVIAYPQGGLFVDR